MICSGRFFIGHRNFFRYLTFYLVFQNIKMKTMNKSILTLSVVACLGGLSATSFAQKSSQAKADNWPQARFEQNNYQSTSTVADVAQFMAALQKKDKSLTTYQPKNAPRGTETGQPLNAWRLAATGKDPLRVYINAGIHAGEVEGKDAMQIILRELMQGKYPEIRQSKSLLCRPTMRMGLMLRIL